MKKENNNVPILLKAIGWAYPELEKIAPELAFKWATRLFFKPVRYQAPPAELLELESALRFKIPYKNNVLQGYSWGTGPVVILQHGWSGRALQFRKFIPRLTEAGFRVVAIDAPAHGKSSGRFTNLVEIAEAMQALAAQFGEIEAVVGHSLGGSASLLAMEYGLRPNKLVTISTPSIPQDIIRNFADQLGASYRVGEYLNAYIEQRYEKPFDWFGSQNVARRLPAEVPALLVHDQHDRDVHLGHQEALSKAMPHAQLLTTSGLGHRRILKDTHTIETVVDFLQAGAQVTDRQPLLAGVELR